MLTASVLVYKSQNVGLIFGVAGSIATFILLYFQYLAIVLEFEREGRMNYIIYGSEIGAIGLLSVTALVTLILMFRAWESPDMLHKDDPSFYFILTVSIICIVLAACFRSVKFFYRG